MQMKSSSKCLVIAAALMAPVASWSAPVVFNFGGLQNGFIDLFPSDKLSYTAQSGGKPVGLSVFAVNAEQPFEPMLVTNTFGGIGAKGTKVLDLLEGAIDGSGLFKDAPGDIIYLKFDQKVVLNSLTFSGWGLGLDKAYVFNPGADCVSALGAVACVKGIGLHDSPNVTQQGVGLLGLDTQFGFGNLTSSSPLGIGSDIFALQACGPLTNFRLNGLSVTSAAAIPEPSVAALMLLGLAGMGFVVRRKRA